MAKVIEKPISKLVSEYAEAVARHGLNSAQAEQIKEANKANTEFTRYAKALDRLKQHLRGKVMQ